MVPAVSRTIQKIKQKRRVVSTIVIAIAFALLPGLIRSIVQNNFPVGASRIASQYTLVLWVVHAIFIFVIMGINLVFYSRNEKDQIHGDVLTRRKRKQVLLNSSAVFFGLLFMGIAHFIVSTSLLSDWALVSIVIENFTFGEIQLLFIRLLQYVIFLVLSIVMIKIDLTQFPASNVKPIAKKEKERVENFKLSNGGKGK